LWPDTPEYHCESGGKLEDIRKANMEMVRQYHADYYRPNNACVLVCGSRVKVDALLRSLNDIDDRLASLRNDDFQRPFPPPKPIAPLLQTSRQHISVPGDTFGRVSIGMRVGPLSDMLHLTALSVLDAYLTDGSHSPLYIAVVDASLGRSVFFEQIF